MRVKDLIEKLSKYDEDEYVTVSDRHDAEYGIDSVGKNVVGGVEIRI
jgi:acyl carrier protein